MKKYITKNQNIDNRVLKPAIYKILKQYGLNPVAFKKGLYELCKRHHERVCAGEYCFKKDNFTPEIDLYICTDHPDFDDEFNVSYYIGSYDTLTNSNSRIIDILEELEQDIIVWLKEQE